MIIVPEIQTVVILIPRTGSGSLRRAIAAKYPKSMLLYRHMEADGIPHGYNRWRKVAVIRNPLDRMWSLYKFLKNFDAPGHDAAYVAKMVSQANRPFSDWLIHNEIVFTSPYDSAGFGRFWPEYTCLHPLPENRKSQFIYARPDLGTELLQFNDLAAIERKFDVKLPHHNKTQCGGPDGEVTTEALDYLKRWHRWDMAMTSPRIAA